MVQTDIVEVSNQQKEARFKVQELSGNVEEVRGQFEEAVQRLTNREKEQSAQQVKNQQIQEQQAGLERKLLALNSDV